MTTFHSNLLQDTQGYTDSPYGAYSYTYSAPVQLTSKSIYMYNKDDND